MQRAATLSVASEDSIIRGKQPLATKWGQKLAVPGGMHGCQDSYTLVNVHAWSFREIGGPMEAVRRCVDLLPPGARVVTAEQLLMLLRDNFGEPVAEL